MMEIIKAIKSWIARNKNTNKPQCKIISNTPKQYSEIKPYVLENGKKYLTDEEIQTILRNAQADLMGEKYSEVLDLYSQIIDNSSPTNSYLPYIFAAKAAIYSYLKNWDKAIENTRKSIELNPGSGDSYLSLGAYITWKYFYTGNFKIDGNYDVLEESIKCYEKCIECNPSNTTARLNILETYIFMRRWYDAIGYNGSDIIGFINSPEEKLRSTWLLCLSLCLAGEAIEDEDIKLLYDHSTAYNTNHDYHQIEDVLNELERVGFDSERLHKAKEIHKLYLSHIKQSKANE